MTRALSVVLRVLAGLALVAASVAASVALLVATGGPDQGSVLFALLVLVAGFVALRFTVPPARRPWPAVRAVLAVALLFELGLLASLPWPPGPAERRPWAVLAALVLGSLAAIVAAGRAPRMAVVLTVLLAGYAAQAVGAFLIGAHWAPRPYSGPGEVFTLEFFLVSIGAFIAAFVLCWPVLRDWVRGARRAA